MEYGKKERHEDFEWFLENYDRIFKEHGHCHVVIKNKKILGVYSGFAEAVRDTENTHRLGTFSVQECTGDEFGYMTYISGFMTIEE